MEHNLLLQDFAIIFSISLPIIFIFNRIKIPALVGYLICGAIIGPYGFGLISSGEQINFLANIGVVFLLFFIGIELSIEDLLKFGKKLIYISFLQLVLTTVVFMLIFLALNLSHKTSIFLGILSAISGTAILLKLLKDRNETNSPQGKISVGITLFQDLSSLFIILLLPLLSEKVEATPLKILYKIFFAFFALALVIILARFLFPKFIYQLARLKIREAFTVGIILIIFASAYFTSVIGLSLALGAFIAGLVLSESDYSSQIVADILPLKDAFISLFFVSIGSMFDINLFLRNWQAIIAFSILIIFLKTFIITFIVKLFNYPGRIGTLTGFYMANIGEFSFVLAIEGMKLNLMDDNMYSIFLPVSIITIIATPFLFFIAPYLSKTLAYYDKIKGTKSEICELSAHIIIVGFGIIGKNLAKVLKEAGLPYVIIELNPDIYRFYKDKEKMIFGDAARYEILQKACVENAKALAITSGDTFSVQLICKLAKNLNRNLTIVARTRYVADIDYLIAAGADEVIPDEFEASMQIFTRVLSIYHIPYNAIMKIANLIRKESYLILREENAHLLNRIDKYLAEGLIENYYVEEGNENAGKTLGEINLRARCGATVIAIIRDGKMLANPSAKDKIESKDILALYGNHDSIDKAIKILDGKTQEAN